MLYEVITLDQTGTIVLDVGFDLAIDGTPRPWRMKVRSPSFVNMQTLGTMVERNNFV